MEIISSRTRSVFITFYSFKGGVGRTMSLLNVACILAGRGRRVLMIDFDLEAPGLTLFKEKSRKNQPPPRQAGLVELIQDFLRNPKESPLADKDNPASFRDHYVRALPIPDKLQQLEGGCLDLMPSGLIDETYQQRLYSIKFDRLYEEGIGQPLFKHFKKVVRDSGLYDYVLIDSRTGLSDEGSICTRDLADHLVVLTGLNRQNVEGTVRVLQQLKAGDWDGGRIIFVASPVPVHYEELREQRMKEARGAIKKAGFDAELKLHIPYHPRLSLDEEPFVYNWTGTDLFQAYQSLQGELRRTAKDTPQDWQQQARKAIENNQFEEALRLIRELTVEAPYAANFVLGWLTGSQMNESAKLKAQAKSFFDLWLTIAEDKAKVHQRHAQILNDQGYFYLALQELNQALINEKKHLTGNTLSIRNDLGWTYFNTGQFDKALDIYTEVLRLAEEANEQFLKAVIRNDIGGLYFHRGDYIEALRSFELALKIFKEIDSTKGITTARQWIGAVHEEQGNYETALTIFEEVHKIEEDVGDEFGKAAIQGNIGRVKILLGDVEEGLRLIGTSNQILERMGIVPLLLARYVDYAVGLVKAKDDKSAKDFLDKQWTFIEQRASAHVRSEAYVVRARLKSGLGDAAGAADDARVALKFYREQRVHNALSREAEALAAAALVGQSKG
jgi:tetratricopeptide (TPR) repeat protein/cellulose biosynthesis protein BcsQ